MAGSASHVKHVRLAHIHHCAWWRSPAPCCEAPFTGPFSGDHQKHVPTLVLSSRVCFCCFAFLRSASLDTTLEEEEKWRRREEDEDEVIRERIHMKTGQETTKKKSEGEEKKRREEEEEQKMD